MIWLLTALFSNWITMAIPVIALGAVAVALFWFRLKTLGFACIGLAVLYVYSGVLVSEGMKVCQGQWQEAIAAAEKHEKEAIDRAADLEDELLATAEETDAKIADLEKAHEDEIASLEDAGVCVDSADDVDRLHDLIGR